MIIQHPFQDTLFHSSRHLFKDWFSVQETTGVERLSRWLQTREIAVVGGLNFHNQRQIALEVTYMTYKKDD